MTIVSNFMNRVEFGKLIASLRREHEDDSDVPWTQAKLAQEANLALGVELFSENMIGKIERGKGSLNQRVLLALADALRLTTGERKEFFLAASGIDNERLPRQGNEPEEVLSQLIQRTKQTCLPAFIIDSYFDFVVYNSVLLRMGMDILGDEAALSVWARPFFCNALVTVFSDEGAEQHRKHGGEEVWSDFASQIMREFRAYSLRYRATEYFQALLQEMKKHRLFKRYWREVYLEEKDHFGQNAHFRMSLPESGPLDFFMSSVTAVTTAGELHFCVPVPANPQTSAAFSRMVESAGPSIIVRLDTWPEKKLCRNPDDPMFTVL